MKRIQPVDIMRYYVTYSDIEKDILTGIKSKIEIERELAFKKYVNKHMRIGRNFRADTWAMVLETTKNYFMEGGKDVKELSDRFFRGGLLSGNNKNAIVAASKLLWLFDKKTIIIDQNNINVLGGKDYVSYSNEWNRVFNEKESEITEIIETLFLDIDEIMVEKWFKMRVFDQFLWSEAVG